MAGLLSAYMRSQFAIEIFMKSSKLSCTLSLKLKRKDKKIWI